MRNENCNLDVPLDVSYYFYDVTERRHQVWRREMSPRSKSGISHFLKLSSGAFLP
jgi:hypothetical protein